MQQFQVLKCAECRSVQVDLCKKENKWSCKVCGQKQSTKRVFFKSESAQNCREKVEELRMNLSQSKPLVKNSQDQPEVMDMLDHMENSNQNPDEQSLQDNTTQPQNKWEKFVKKPEASSPKGNLRFSSSRRRLSPAAASNSRETSPVFGHKGEISHVARNFEHKPPMKKAKVQDEQKLKVKKKEDDWSIFM